VAFETRNADFEDVLACGAGRGEIEKRYIRRCCGELEQSKVNKLKIVT